MSAQLYTIEEAAQRLRRKSARQLRDWLRDHPAPAGEPPYYRQMGRDRLFSEHDLVRIEQRVTAEELKKSDRLPLNISRGCIYFIRIDGFIKIGWARNPKIRVAQLQIGSPYIVELLGVAHGTMRDEKRLHKQLSEYRERGEWFRDSSRLRRIIKAMSNSRLRSEIFEP